MHGDARARPAHQHAHVLLAVGPGWRPRRARPFGVRRLIRLAIPFTSGRRWQACAQHIARHFFRGLYRLQRAQPSPSLLPDLVFFVGRVGLTLQGQQHARLLVLRLLARARSLVCVHQTDPRAARTAKRLDPVEPTPFGAGFALDPYRPFDLTLHTLLRSARRPGRGSDRRKIGRCRVGGEAAGLVLCRCVATISTPHTCELACVRNGGSLGRGKAAQEASLATLLYCGLPMPRARRLIHSLEARLVLRREDRRQLRVAAVHLV
mmetsp:Transcript_22693/g.56362  ORF Transcript_22693/g.56362 Transcript_22693/m.56362 type:complete len:264 (+) Transcript_22693:3259-4050(+)